MVEFLNRYVALGKEAANAYGTEVDPTAFGEVDDESFATRMDLLTRQDMSRPVVGKSVTGKEYSEGGYNMAVQLDEFLGNTLAAFFPKTVVSTGIHTFSEPTVAADVYNSYTIDVGREEKIHTYTGMVANTLSLTATVGEYVMMSADFVGCREKATQADISDTAVTFEGDALDALYFSNGTVFFDNGDGSDQSDVSASVKSIDFQISLNPDTDNAMALGDSTYSSKPKMQRREVTGTVEFNKVLYGAQTTDDPDYTSLITTTGLAYNDGAVPVMILHFTEEDTPADNYIKFNFYNIRWEAPTSNVSGRDSQTMSVGFVGLYDNNLGCMDITAKGGALGSTAF
jgi:hypothetical protein